MIVDDQGGVEVVVSHSAGDSWTNVNAPYLASPVNVAMLDGVPVLIFADRLKKGKAIKVTLLGAARLLEQGQKTTYMIAVPTKASEQTIAIKDFSDLVTAQSSAKWIVEQYLLSRNGMGSATLVSWEDQNYVLTKVLDNKNNN